MRAQHSGPSHRAQALTALKKEPPIRRRLAVPSGLIRPALALRGWEQGQRPRAPGTWTSRGRGCSGSPTPELLRGELSSHVTSATASGPDECVSQGLHSATESSLSLPGPSASLQQPSAGTARARFPGAAEGAGHHRAMCRQLPGARMRHTSTQVLPSTASVY